MDDLLKNLESGSLKTEEKKKDTQKKETPKKSFSENKKEGFFVKNLERTKFVKISDPLHKKIKNISKKNRIPINEVVDKMLNYVIEKYNL